MNSLLNQINTIKDRLTGHIENPDFEAKYILAQILSLPIPELYIHKNRIISPDEQQTIASVVKQRVQHKPLQYIFGKTFFMGLEFQVDERVLIPRPETELLVQRICDDFSVNRNGNSPAHKSLLDIGTGSGAIAVSLKKHFPGWTVAAADISSAALEVARHNSLQHGTDISLITSDVFSNITGKYDILVSNPPYIAPQEVCKLPNEIRDYEPHLALMAEDEGLYYYRAILSQAKTHLNDNGVIYFEIGSEQASQITNIAFSLGFETRKVDKDYNLFDRVLTIYPIR